ncbi:hypothetical protein ABFX02_13G028200 [Erythranthe guttata]
MDDETSPLLQPLERRRFSTLSYICMNYWFIFIILITLIICFVSIFTIWLVSTFVVDMPKLYLQQLYIPALDLSENPIATTAAAAPVNPTLFFDLKFVNPTKGHIISCGDGEVTFFYGFGRRLDVANYTVGGIVLDKGETAYRRGVVEARGVPWDGALETVSGGSAAVFGVEVAVEVRFGYYWFWYSSKRWSRVGSDVEVGASGRKLQSDAVRLTSAANRRSCHHRFPALTFVVLSVLLVLVV